MTKLVFFRRSIAVLHYRNLMLCVNVEMFVFLFATGLLGFVLSTQLPSHVKLCSKKDPNFLKCVELNMKEAIESFGPGYETLGIPQLEPFYVEKMEIQGSQTGSVHLDQKYEQIYIHGFSRSDISNLSIDHQKCHWEFDSSAPYIRMESNYELKGQLLIFPINGHGKSNVTMHKVHVHYVLDCKRHQKKGEPHLRITKFKMTMKPERINFHFENLIPGNEQVSNEVSKTVNENALDIFKDVKGAFEQVFEQIYIATTNRVFSKIKESDIFLE